MRRTAALLLLAGSLTGTFATTAAANVCSLRDYVFCTVDCVSQHDPSVDPGRTPAVDLGRPSCMDQDG